MPYNLKYVELLATVLRKQRSVDSYDFEGYRPKNERSSINLDYLLLENTHIISKISLNNSFAALLLVKMNDFPFVSQPIPTPYALPNFFYAHISYLSADW